MLKPFSQLEIDTIRRTWRLIEPQQQLATDLIYENLFKEKPELELLFVREQRHNMTQAISRLIDGVDDLPRLLPYVANLAVMHVQFGVKKEDYPVAGVAFIKTLKQVLGPDFTKEDEIVWNNVYKILSKIMIKHAYPNLFFRIVNYIIKNKQTALARV